VMWHLPLPEKTRAKVKMGCLTYYTLLI